MNRFRLIVVPSLTRQKEAKDHWPPDFPVPPAFAAEGPPRPADGALREGTAAAAWRARRLFHTRPEARFQHRIYVVHASAIWGCAQSSLATVWRRSSPPRPPSSVKVVRLSRASLLSLPSPSPFRHRKPAATARNVPLPAWTIRDQDPCLFLVATSRGRVMRRGIRAVIRAGPDDRSSSSRAETTGICDAQRQARCGFT